MDWQPKTWSSKSLRVAFTTSWVVAVHLPCTPPVFTKHKGRSHLGCEKSPNPKQVEQVAKNKVRSARLFACKLGGKACRTAWQKSHSRKVPCCPVFFLGGGIWPMEMGENPLKMVVYPWVNPQKWWLRVDLLVASSGFLNICITVISWKKLCIIYIYITQMWKQTPWIKDPFPRVSPLSFPHLC